MTKTLYIIDDDEGILDAFQAILDDLPHKVFTFRSADFTTKLSKNHLPDLIILDVLLSGQDGREICKDLKNNKQTKHIPIIMVSAHPEAEFTAKQSGADSYLKKPFDIDDLLTMVNHYLSDPVETHQ